jgi:hypothetical protein
MANNISLVKVADVDNASEDKVNDIITGVLTKLKLEDNDVEISSIRNMGKMEVGTHGECTVIFVGIGASNGNKPTLRGFYDTIRAEEVAAPLFLANNNDNNNYFVQASAPSYNLEAEKRMLKLEKKAQKFQNRRK